MQTWGSGFLRPQPVGTVGGCMASVEQRGTRNPHWGVVWREAGIRESEKFLTKGTFNAPASSPVVKLQTLCHHQKLIVTAPRKSAL